MARMGKFSADGLKKFQEKLNKIQQQDVDAFVESCAKEIAARLIAKAVKRTPVGDYSKEIQVTAKRDSKKHKKGDVYTKRVNPSGRKGGVLRRGWTSKTHEEAKNKKGNPSVQEINEFVEGLRVNHVGNMLQIVVENPVEYASYVEYGHVQTPGRYVPALGRRLKKAWAPGKLMLTISEQEVQEIAPKLLEAKIAKYLRECMG